MKLFDLILALSCIIAYTVAQNREQRRPFNAQIEGLYQFGVNPLQDSNVANLNPPFFDAKGHLRLSTLFGNRVMAFSSGTKSNVVPASKTQRNSQSSNILNEDNSSDAMSSQALPPSFRW